jgi:hypothetical protein
MAARVKIEEFSEGNIRGEVQYDGGVEPGGEHFMVVYENGEKIFVRTWYWDRYNSHHAKNFVSKLARDEEYRQRCKNGDTVWARVRKAYNKLWTSVQNVYGSIRSSHGEDAHKEASDLVEKHYRRLHEELEKLYKEADGLAWDCTEEVAEAVKVGAIQDREELKKKYEPNPPEHKITFGKHEGKSLREIANEHPGYAEWGAEELDNRPGVQRGFKELIENNTAN